MTFAQTATKYPVAQSRSDLIPAAESRATFWQYPAGADCSVCVATGGNKHVVMTRKNGVWENGAA